MVRLAMVAARKPLFDKRKAALTRARLRAWWDGAEFDEAAALGAIEAAANAAANDTGGADDELFDEPPFELSPRLRALLLLWGEGRVRPGDDSGDQLEPARLGLASDGVLCFLSPGLAAPVMAIAAAHPGKIDVFEWREETFEALKYGVRKAKLEHRVTVARIDLDAHVWPAATYDGLLSIDDFAYAGHPPHLAHQIIKGLKPGACAVIESYLGERIPDYATAFASAFAEPQIRPRKDVLHYLGDVGFMLEADEDLTEECLDLARQGFKRLSGALTQSAQVDPAAAQELAWEVEAWRARMKLLAQRRLERRRLILRRPPDGADQTANANDPAG